MVMAAFVFNEGLMHVPKLSDEMSDVVLPEGFQYIEIPMSKQENKWASSSKSMCTCICFYIKIHIDLCIFSYIHTYT